MREDETGGWRRAVVAKMREDMIGQCSRKNSATQMAWIRA